MKEPRLLPIIPATPAPSGTPADEAARLRVSRRAALQSLAVGLGAGLAAPALGEAHPVQAHLAHVAASQAAAADGPFTPEFFDEHQYATVRLLSALIVPGADASGTPEFLDKLLAVESTETRRRFISALGAMDAAAREAHGVPFKDLTSEQQHALLTTASTQAPSRTPVFWKKGDPIPLPEPVPAPLNLRDHFDHLKGWIAGIHFSSEPGLKELGWTGVMFFEKFDGCVPSA